MLDPIDGPTAVPPVLAFRNPGKSIVQTLEIARSTGADEYPVGHIAFAAAPDTRSGNCQMPVPS